MSTAALLLLLAWAHADIAPPMAPWPEQAPEHDLAAPPGPPPRIPCLPILLGGVLVAGVTSAAVVLRHRR